MDQSIPTRSLRRQTQLVSYTENQANSDSGIVCDDEYNNQDANILPSSCGESIESTSVGDMPRFHEVPTESGPPRKRIAIACDSCRRKKSKVCQYLIAP
jgi:hypothetical protein